MEKVLTDHTASNVQKKKTNRKINKPMGPARYDPNSSEWEEILLEQSTRNNKGTKRSILPVKSAGPPAKKKNMKASGAKKLRN